MDLSRRDVLKGATAVAAGVALAGNMKPGLTHAQTRDARYDLLLKGGAVPYNTGLVQVQKV